MKKHILIILLVYSGLIFTLQSCSDFLETEPESFLEPEDYYKTEEQLFTALIGVHNTLSDTRDSSPLYGGDYIHQMGTEGELGYYRHTPQRNIISQFLYNPSAPSLSNVWDRLYQGINHANYLLESIDNAEMDNEVNRDIFRGEALFLRSYFYFMLTSHFGDVPLVLKATRTAEEARELVPQSKSSIIYQQIIEDMEKAFDLVQTASKLGYGGRINKSAVAGILARVNLHWAGYPNNEVSRYIEAKKWAATVMNPSLVGTQHALNPSYEQVFINYAQDTYDVSESIWEVEFFGNRTDHPRQAGTVGNYNGIRSSAASGIGNANGNIRATATLFFMYEDGDLRRDWAIAPFDYNDDGSKEYRTDNETQIWGRYAGKYRREYELVLPKTSFTPINFPMLRYSDVLLMFAEAENYLNGPTEEAINAVNRVRARAQAPLLEGANLPVDQTEFFLFLKEERARELCFECLRRGDLIRWNDYVESIEAMVSTYEYSTTVSAATKTLIVNLKNVAPKHMLWPIPTKELMLNSLLVQNEGW
ncbi:RagB/SusD family nutrient uptake outer membrane protein [Aestuariibaculum sediminum]|uniref:RagB/SusD family nutrient uptake outer membrane protein n=1 Tax=Aestuariibaculum sediminum TaxID=2770637 RepID=A0A8J6U8Z1_9FLAO|nr:RagB/SusD family nutrient uptake outer membrane protein [Aestuariibaculum sediminum]MBD0833668.1 RagB/SusD family nutrient uptake outer membrane protein [Aestuariibaculum sediminum]